MPQVARLRLNLGSSLLSDLMGPTKRKSTDGANKTKKSAKGLTSAAELRVPVDALLKDHVRVFDSWLSPSQPDVFSAHKPADFSRSHVLTQHSTFDLYLDSVFHDKAGIAPEALNFVIFLGSRLEKSWELCERRPWLPSGSGWT